MIGLLAKEENRESRERELKAHQNIFCGRKIGYGNVAKTNNQRHSY
jgi:hypothetical protein